MINKTNDYSIFRKHTSNRELNNENLNKIKNSILLKDMLRLRPIIVNKSMEIIDGQHRLEIAKQLRKDIYYIIQEDAEDIDIITLNNNQRAWTYRDYLNYYCSQGREEYIKLQSFIDKNIIKDITNALIILGQHGSYYMQIFKDGRLKLPNNLNEFQNKWVCIKAMQDRLDAMMVGNDRNFYKGARFIRALVVVSNIEKFDFNHFLKRFESRLNAVHSCNNIADYVEMFKGIYNYRSLNPLD